MLPGSSPSSTCSTTFAAASSACAMLPQLPCTHQGFQVFFDGIAIGTGDGNNLPNRQPPMFSGELQDRQRKLGKFIEQHSFTLYFSPGGFFNCSTRRKYTPGLPASYTLKVFGVIPWGWTNYYQFSRRNIPALLAARESKVTVSVQPARLAIRSIKQSAKSAKPD